MELYEALVGRLMTCGLPEWGARLVMAGFVIFITVYLVRTALGMANRMLDKGMTFDEAWKSLCEESWRRQDEYIDKLFDAGKRFFKVPQKKENGGSENHG